jgi:DNA sulfur modification protein DndC
MVIAVRRLRHFGKDCLVKVVGLKQVVSMLDTLTPSRDPDELRLEALLDAIRVDMRDEYLQPHPRPWIVGFSGGKDSTVVAHLVFELLLSLPPHQRQRPIHIISNDTLVESPLVINHIESVQAEMTQAAEAFGLPIIVATTQPDIEGTFWVNLIGRGYPSPNRNFRWCTDRMKIKPTSEYVRREASKTGQVILLLGVRRSESATRAGVVARYDNGERLNAHNDLFGCLVYRPIVELSTEDVWEFLGSNPPPWGASHSRLIALYRNAQGGECPVVTQKSDVPSCGTSSSSRFGCWTCTVVEKDRSLIGFVDAGFKEFGPLIEFRDWLTQIRNKPNLRSAARRSGRYTVRGDTFIPGPFTLAARGMILERLRALECEVGHALISESELNRIGSLWAEEAASALPGSIHVIQTG